MSLFDIAIVNFNTRELLLDCLETVLPEQPNQVIVLDNASSDGSAEQVRATLPDPIVLESRVNRGYSTAANQAIAACSAKYVLLLNSDTLLAPGILEALSAYLEEHPAVAIVGPRLLNPDGTLQPSCFPFPTLFDLFLDMTTLGKWLSFIPYLRTKYLRTWAHDQPLSVPWVLGAALAIRLEAFKQVGGFDETYFMYYEEVDLCYRLRREGWQIHFAPVSTITHLGGASTRQQRTEMTVHFYSSLAHFYRRHYSHFRLVLLILLVRWVVLARLVRDKIRFHLTYDAQQRTLLFENMAAWRRLLFTNWQGQVNER